jgi:hypothetical protein
MNGLAEVKFYGNYAQYIKSPCIVLLRIITGLILLLITRLIITHTMFALVGLYDLIYNTPPVTGEKDLGVGFEAIGFMTGGIVYGIPLALSFAIVSYGEIIKILEGIYRYVYHCRTLGRIVSIYSYFTEISSKEIKAITASRIIISLTKKIISLVFSFGLFVFFAISMSLILGGAYLHFHTMKGNLAIFAGWVIFLLSWASLVLTFPMIRYFYKKINKLIRGENVKL